MEERSRERPLQPEGLRKAASLTEERDRSRDAGKVGAKKGDAQAKWGLLQTPSCYLSAVKREGAAAPAVPTKAALSEEELEKKSKAIIEEFLHLNDMKVSEV